ncbi:TPA: hypothetical protein N0F65_001280 [Lagenidium giganteum]|uniref:Transmembrane protein n=1 Tax=Lagenidium giganteum TaxID=4803 RepID=A0AAV2Z2R1_9STRA|nr:TPA: hypothetical protein N0F65_001280 [Lagenidium giganteum]
MQLQSSVKQRGLAADIRQRDDNSSRKLLPPKDRRFLNRVIHDTSLAHQPDVDKRLMSLATRSGANPYSLSMNTSSQAENRNGLSTVFATAGALAVFGTGAYYTYRERARKREEQERQRKEKERQRKERQYRFTIAVVVLGVIGLWYSGWLFVVLGFVLVALLVACACSS